MTFSIAPNDELFKYVLYIFSLNINKVTGFSKTNPFYVLLIFGCIAMLQGKPGRRARGQSSFGIFLDFLLLKVPFFIKKRITFKACFILFCHQVS